MNQISSVCVYCSASPRLDPFYYDQAYQLGALIARAGIQVVYGGGRLGLMGNVANGAMEAGGRVIGFMPDHLQNLEKGHAEITEFHVVSDMHTRKRCMFENSEAFIVMPGGFGTLDEVFEIVTWRQIGLHDKPIVLVNINDYWTPLKNLVDNVVRENFALPEHGSYFHFVDSIHDVLPLLHSLPGCQISPKPEVI